MSKNIVVVESPAKAKTINRYLGNDFLVLASYGHIRDLAARNGSVNPDDGFSMTWETTDRSEKQINEIIKAVKGADHLYLATDPDREGEAISWHVQKVLEERNVLKNTTVQRIVFHEITKSAIQQSMKQPRQVDMALVDAYLARRALDYLVGFTLSPVLWRKLPGSRSAGRVQSVALRLIVEREQEIEVFKTQEYWTITAVLLNPKTQAFQARLTHFEGKKLEKFDIPAQEVAEKIVKALNPQDLTVIEVEKKQAKRHPAAPFITSTLQQEASRKLGFGTSRTMQIAQRLYEGVDIAGETTGLITYMRTDSVTLSQDAIEQARAFLLKDYGKEYVPSQPRQFKSKAKNAQEAHEAIRPTLLARRPQEVAAYLDEAQYKLYDLIWKRTLASQMESALFDQVGVDIANATKTTMFRATGSTQVFDGFLRLYQEGVDDESENPEGDSLLPPLHQNDKIDKQSITPNQHFTQPPPRFTEASLVKKMEELGIGRPSTYASLIQVLQDRDYVRLEKKQFMPEDRGRLVTSFLVHFFKRYVEYDFTAHLEEQLDEISAGKQSWKDVMATFWKDFYKTVEDTQPLRVSEVIDKLEQDLSQYLFQDIPKEQRVCPGCQEGIISLKLGKFGAFLGCSRYPDCKHTKPLGKTEEGQEAGFESAEPKVIGVDPDSKETILLKKGPYGPYLEWEGSNVVVEVAPVEEEGTSKKKKKKPAKPKPKRVSIPTGFDKDTITLEIAVKLKALPKQIGLHPETTQPLVLGIGRFGPYVKHGDVFASVPRAENVLDLGFERACQLVDEKAQKPKSTRRAPLKKPTKAKAANKAKPSKRTSKTS